ncbi:hypothetical protein ACQ4M3_12915 [Leptolyngbya sp. AN03gr2]|uniref:hypothetical protein n=1 Tax=unclassified Leptolyngbya TaxID=2650499 RepID=UPI003D31204B
MVLQIKPIDSNLRGSTAFYKMRKAPELYECDVPEYLLDTPSFEFYPIGSASGFEAWLQSLFSDSGARGVCFGDASVGKTFAAIHFARNHSALQYRYVSQQVPVVFIRPEPCTLLSLLKDVSYDIFPWVAVSQCRGRADSGGAKYWQPKAVELLRAAKTKLLIVDTSSLWQPNYWKEVLQFFDEVIPDISVALIGTPLMIDWFMHQTPSLCRWQSFCYSCLDEHQCLELMRLWEVKALGNHCIDWQGCSQLLAEITGGLPERVLGVLRSAYDLSYRRQAEQEINAEQPKKCWIYHDDEGNSRSTYPDKYWFGSQEKDDAALARKVLELKKRTFNISRFIETLSCELVKLEQAKIASLSSQHFFQLRLYESLREYRLTSEQKPLLTVLQLIGDDYVLRQSIRNRVIFAFENHSLVGDLLLEDLRIQWDYVDFSTIDGAGMSPERIAYALDAYFSLKNQSDVSTLPDLDSVSAMLSSFNPSIRQSSDDSGVSRYLTSFLMNELSLSIIRNRRRS